MKRLRFVSFVCVIVLVCVLAAGLPANAATYRGDTVYYTVVNDAMLELTYASMPIMRDGKIYVPYSLFVTYFDVKSSYSAADQVLFLYRDEYYKNEKEDPTQVETGTSEVIVAKNRHGELGTVKLSWSGEFTQFTSLELHRSER